MPREARQPAASGVYHIMWRGIDKAQLFRDAVDDVQFLTLLRDSLDEHFEVLAYCLMSNHLHLLVKTEKRTTACLETGMKRLGIRYAAYYNRRYERNGHLFQDRFKSCPVETVSYFLRVLRYIHMNPVAAGLAQNPQDYPWSSYRDYFTGRENVLCPVSLSYALSLRPLDWLEKWHRQTEQNPQAFAEGRQTIPDAQAAALFQTICGCAPQEILNLPKEKQVAVFRRLLREERLRIPQLSRLTGISRGVIRRIAL